MAEEEDGPAEEEEERPLWHNEFWSIHDGAVLNLQLFDACSIEFKRLMLRELRMFEFLQKGLETWFDPEKGKAVTIDSLPEDRLPPFREDLIGVKLGPHEVLCRGGDFERSLMVVLDGTLDKWVGDSCREGRVMVRELDPGECEGLSEFLGAGHEQRTALYKAGAEGCRVRLIPREPIDKLLALEKPEEEEEESPIPDEFTITYSKEWKKELEEWRQKLQEVGTVLENYECNDKSQRVVEVCKPGAKMPGAHRFPLSFVRRDLEEPAPPEMLFQKEIEHFRDLRLERIDSIPHQQAMRLLEWMPGWGLTPGKGYPGPGEPIRLMDVKGQQMFEVANQMGMSVSGPLAEGLEERYFMDNQIVCRKGVVGDSVIIVLRGECAAEIPDDCLENCVPSLIAGVEPDILERAEDWLGDGCREPGKRADLSRGEEVAEQLEEDATSRQMDSLDMMVMEETNVMGQFGGSGETYKKGDAYMNFAKKLWASSRGLKDPFRTPTPPPTPPGPPEPLAVLKPGAMVGTLALLGMEMYVSGTIRARGSCLVAILHRRVLFEAFQGCQEIEFFRPRGLSQQERREVLGAPKHQAAEGSHRGKHLGPATGPPEHHSLSGSEGFAAGSYAAYSDPTSKFTGRAGADALQHVLLQAMRTSNLLWTIIGNEPNRLLDAVYGAFELRWLLPNEAVVSDEDGIPNSDTQMLFVCLHGNFVVSVVGAEIEWAGQGAVFGEAQLLALSSWTRKIIVDPRWQGEALVAVLRREKLAEVLAGHPQPRQKLLRIEDSLSEIRTADWRILKRVPAWGSVASKAFLARLFLDADICFFCPGDHVSVKDEHASSLCVVLAGKLRSEQANTLFCVEQRRGDWAFQNNVLGNTSDRNSDVVSVDYSLVLFIYRHVLLSACVDFPDARAGVVENETWRVDALRLNTLRIFETIPKPVMVTLETACTPQYFMAGCIIVAANEFIPHQSLYVLIRGEAVVIMYGVVVRHLKVGDAIGELRFLDLPQPPGPVEYKALTPCDILAVPRAPLVEASADERYEDDMKQYVIMAETFYGEELKDAFGISLNGVGRQFAVDCVETSHIFSCCSDAFREQLHTFVEDVAYYQGQILFDQGDLGGKIWFIQAGRVRCDVEGGEEEPKIVTAGATLGELATLGVIAEQDCTAVCECPVWARVLDKRLMDRAVKAFPGEDRRLAASPKFK